MKTSIKHHLLFLTRLNMILVSLALVLTSCMTYKKVSTGEGAPGLSKTIRPGNHVKLILNNGKKIQDMKVTLVNSVKIVGISEVEGSANKTKRHAVLLSDIKVVKKRKFSIIKTAALVVGLWAAGSIVVKEIGDISIALFENMIPGPDLQGLSHVSDLLDGMM